MIVRLRYITFTKRLLVVNPQAQKSGKSVYKEIKKFLMDILLRNIFYSRKIKIQIFCRKIKFETNNINGHVIYRILTRIFVGLISFTAHLPTHPVS